MAACSGPARRPAGSSPCDRRNGPPPVEVSIEGQRELDPAWDLSSDLASSHGTKFLRDADTYGPLFDVDLYPFSQCVQDKMTHAKIARRFKCSESTVRRRLAAEKLDLEKYL